MRAFVGDRLSRALRAARDFLRGFVGMPGAQLPEGDSHCVQHALEERASRRRSCC